MKSVLIVEDNPAVYYALQFVLKDNGYQIFIAEDLKECEVILYSEQIDVILLDYNLPDGRGDVLLRHLRQDQKSKIPVIVMSATSKVEMAHKMLELGANHYLHKPFSMDDLIHVLDYWTQLDVAQ